MPVHVNTDIAGHDAGAFSAAANSALACATTPALSIFPAWFQGKASVRSSHLLGTANDAS
jgi:hypothetical protein